MCCNSKASIASPTYFFGSHSSLFQLKVIQWVYFQAMNDHVQQLVSKGGCGLFVFTPANDPKVICELLNLHMKL